jgi:hypothetical protein
MKSAESSKEGHGSHKGCSSDHDDENDEFGVSMKLNGDLSCRMISFKVCTLNV